MTVTAALVGLRSPAFGNRTAHPLFVQIRSRKAGVSLLFIASLVVAGNRGMLHPVRAFTEPPAKQAKLNEVHRTAIPISQAEDVGRSEHNAYQAKVFDEHADFFAGPSAVPPAAVPRMERIASELNLEANHKILDVATGTGAMLPYLAKEGAMLSQVVGVDLSERMLSFAKQNFPEVSFVQGDILEYGKSGSTKFDRILFNACFANFLDPVVILQHTAEHLAADNALIAISHPLGRGWLNGLREKDPRMVPNHLPDEAELHEMLAKVPSLSVEAFFDEAEYYCVLLRRNSH